MKIKHILLLCSAALSHQAYANNITTVQTPVINQQNTSKKPITLFREFIISNVISPIFNSQRPISVTINLIKTLIKHHQGDVDLQINDLEMAKVVFPYLNRIERHPDYNSFMNENNAKRLEFDHMYEQTKHQIHNAFNQALSIQEIESLAQSIPSFSGSNLEKEIKPWRLSKISLQNTSLVPDDLSQPIEQIYLGGGTTRVNGSWQNFQLSASVKDILKDELGIDTHYEHSSSSFWVEDNKILTSNQAGEIAIITPFRKTFYDEYSKDDMEAALTNDNMLHDSYYKFGGFHSSGLSKKKRKYLAGVPIYNDQSRVTERLQQDILTNDPTRLVINAPTLLDIDGGNLLVGKKANGETYAIVGRDSILITIENNFGSDFRKEPPKNLPDFLSFYFDEVRLEHEKSVVQEYYAQSSREDDTDRFEYYKTYLANLRYDSVTDDDVFQLLAYMELTEELIATTFHIERENLAIVTQPGFHIDMYMRPYKNGTVLINAPEEVEAFLSDVLTEQCGDTTTSVNTQLCSDVEYGLRRVRNKNADQKRIEIFNHIIDELNAKGINAMKVPAVFKLAKGDQGKYAKLTNYMNGIMLKGTNKNYYLTLSSPYTTINDSFVEWINRKNPELQDLHILFSNHPNEAGWTSQTILNLQGGIDCATLHFEQ